MQNLAETVPRIILPKDCAGYPTELLFLNASSTEKVFQRSLVDAEESFTIG